MHEPEPRGSVRIGRVSTVDEGTNRPDAPILLVTKLHPPTVPAQIVAREPLFARLASGRDRRLSLVACPAGFGKSTLLAAWRESEVATRPVAWVTLDEGDDDAVVLWSHVVEALARACPALDGEALSSLVAVAPLLEVALPRLVNALAEQPEIALVLDDFHRLSAHSTRESVAWFVERMPGTVQLVLSTRTDPALPLGTLRARGQLLELRADDLRFTVAEATEFLNGRLGLGLSTPDVELLVARTEGWPAGIYLAALSLAGSDDRHGLVRAFDGTTAHVVDFLAGEVLAAHSPDLQRFMLRTSVLERLCAPLCRAVLGEPGSSRALEELARTNLFLLPLDDRGRWFRFHHLFAQILRVELERREPGLVPELHRRAHEWHVEHGTADEAIHHAVSAGAFPEAGRLIAESWVHYANVGRTASVSEWLRRFPDPIIDADARLLLVRAWVAALRGRQDAMRAAVDRVRELGGLDEGPLPDGFASLESSLSVLTATFAWGDAPAILEHGMRSAELEGPDSPWRPVITWAVGWAHLCHDDLDEAERWLRETTELTPRTNQWIVGVAAIADLSLIAGRRGDRDEQMRLALEAVELARGCGLLDAVEDGEVHTAHGVALAAHGRMDEALEELERGVFLRRLWGQPLDLADGLIELGSHFATIGDRRRATEVFDEAERTLDGCAGPAALPARLAAARRAARIGRPASDALSDRELTVLRLLRSGLTEREIGRELYLSFNTVHSHVKAVYRKLGVSTRAEAVARSEQVLTAHPGEIPR
jgi:LuxR family transcriptional regulator, maltose regulon positive regulatory protein